MDRLAIRSPRVCGAIVEFVYGDLAASPARVGVRLGREVTGSWRAARGAYRIIYGFDETAVLIKHVDHRADLYRPR